MVMGRPDTFCTHARIKRVVGASGELRAANQNQPEAARAEDGRLSRHPGGPRAGPERQAVKRTLIACSFFRQKHLFAGNVLDNAVACPSSEAPIAQCSIALACRGSATHQAS